MNTKLKSLFYLSCSQGLVATNIISVKYAVQFISPQVYTCLRYQMAFLCSFLFCLLGKQKFSVKNYKNYFPILIMQALCGGILFNIPMTIGLQYTDASVAGTITSILPIMTLLLSWIFFRTQISRHHILAVVASCIGLYCITHHSSFSPHAHSQLRGDFLVLIALIPEALYYVLTQRYTSPIPLKLNACFSFGINVIVFFILFFKQNINWLHIPASISLLIALQGLGLTLNYLLWLKGCEHSDQILISLAATFMPMITIFLSVLFLHETLNATQTFGILLILFTLMFYEKTNRNTVVPNKSSL